jgi:Na+:H+ antiporter, NhaA family
VPRPSPAALSAAIRRFAATEAASGAACMAAIVVALGWANSPWHSSYLTLWTAHVASAAGPLQLPGDVAHWVADGGMTVFFFVIGLELKRELVSGQLQDKRTAALPVLAAVGGMVLPAVLYLVLAAGVAPARGWVVPMATDLAVTLGVIAVLGHRVPAGMKVFLLTLAIVDDVGAVAAIAIGLTRQLDLAALAVAIGLVAVLFVLASRRVAPPAVVLLLSLGVWLATFRSGVHPTIAGVACALALPVSDWTASLEDRLHTVAASVIVPLFIVAEAGVRFSSVSLASGPAARVFLAVGGALVFGKAAGVTGAAWLAARLRIGRLPEGAGWGDLVGMAVLCGIGLTVAVLAADFSFTAPAQQQAAKLGVLTGSAVAAVVGSGIFVARRRRAD